MITATIISPVTAEAVACLGHSVYSSAMRCWALVVNNDNDPELLVLFREGGTVYRYAFKDWAAAREWDAIRHDEQWAADEEAEPVSWGRCFHAFLREGLILPIAA
jgi:hypothetical protein